MPRGTQVTSLRMTVFSPSVFPRDAHLACARLTPTVTAAMELGAQLAEAPLDPRAEAPPHATRGEGQTGACVWYRWYLSVFARSSDEYE